MNKRVTSGTFIAKDATLEEIAKWLIIEEELTEADIEDLMYYIDKIGGANE